MMISVMDLMDPVVQDPHPDGANHSNAAYTYIQSPWFMKSRLMYVHGV